jgi:hypothetical protein
MIPAERVQREPAPATGGHVNLNRPKGLAVRPQRFDPGDDRLLFLDGDKLAIRTLCVTERYFAAEVSTSRLLVGLHLADPLLDAIALGFGKGECPTSSPGRSPLARGPTEGRWV